MVAVRVFSPFVALARPSLGCRVFGVVVCSLPPVRMGSPRLRRSPRSPTLPCA
jgi:hypothetical protein